MSRASSCILSAILIYLVCAAGAGATDVSKTKEVAKIKDYGVLGQLFRVEEQSLLEEIAEKLELARDNGKLEQLQQQFNKRVRERILRPLAVANIGKAKEDRQWVFDTTYRQETDIVDSNGRLIVKAGTTINPLKKLSWREPFIFIDGDDQEQVAWARGQMLGRIILVNGAPLEVSEQLDRRVYFDQGGIYTRKFSIKNVPAIVRQQGDALLVSEVRI